MALCFKALSVFLAFSFVAASEPSRPRFNKALQADVCEMLRDSHSELQMRYPNEFYDCTAHGRFFKEASLPKAADGSFAG